jgi:hypothetical protein
MIIKFKPVDRIEIEKRNDWRGSGSETVHSQCLHKQAEIATMIREDFMRIIRTHEAKIKVIDKR